MGEPRRGASLTSASNPAAANERRLLGAAAVGRRLKTVRDDLAKAGTGLREALGEGETELVGEGLRLLAQQVCRIAVIGQIKAGKSSFINTLVERHDLLPTDVNPWTTAVTRLNFAHRVGQPAASFQFFSAAEWDRLAEPRGRLGELTERFVPGFERNLLRQHIAAVRHRAERRLGPAFAELLGEAHGYDAVAGEILRRYVCAGDPVGLTEPGALTGQFADITKSAELNIDGGPFAFPTTIIDTPGTNDPFLVRDEITRSCLDSADIYLVVLSAKQPLGPSDIALLRILRGLHKEQIVVFINRIDELADIRAERDAVVEFVKQRLARELPGSSIPVIAGSAWWGHQALAFKSDGFERAIDSRSLGYFQDAGLIRRDDLVRPASQGAERARLLREALMAGSGIPAVHAMLDDMLRECRIPHVMSQLIGSFGEMARATRDRANRDLATLARDFDETVVTTQRSGQELQRLHDEMARLEEVVAVIETSESSFRTQLTDIVTSETTALRGRLIAAVDEFSSREARALYEALAQGSAMRRWSCDTDKLRRALAADFVQGYRTAERRIQDLHDKVLPQLRHLLSLLTGQAPADAPAERTTSKPAAPPRMTALSTRLVLDLHMPWWRAWWGERPTPAERSRELAELVRSDLFPLVDQLMTSCTEELDARVASTSKWTFGMSSAILNSLRAQHERLLAHYQSLSDSLDGKADPDTVVAKRAYIAALQQRGSLADAIAREIASLAAALQSTLTPPKTTK